MVVNKLCRNVIPPKKRRDTNYKMSIGLLQVRGKSLISTNENYNGKSRIHLKGNTITQRCINMDNRYGLCYIVGVLGDGYVIILEKFN